MDCIKLLKLRVRADIATSASEKSSKEILLRFQLRNDNAFPVRVNLFDFQEIWGVSGLAPMASIRLIDELPVERAIQVAVESDFPVIPPGGEIQKTVRRWLPSPPAVEALELPEWSRSTGAQTAKIFAVSRPGSYAGTIHLHLKPLETAVPKELKAQFSKVRECSGLLADHEFRMKVPNPR